MTAAFRFFSTDGVRRLGFVRAGQRKTRRNDHREHKRQRDAECGKKWWADIRQRAGRRRIAIVIAPMIFMPVLVLSIVSTISMSVMSVSVRIVIVSHQVRSSSNRG